MSWYDLQNRRKKGSIFFTTQKKLCVGLFEMDPKNFQEAKSASSENRGRLSVFVKVLGVGW
jgi:hypothetical protein